VLVDMPMSDANGQIPPQAGIACGLARTGKDPFARLALIDMDERAQSHLRQLADFDGSETTGLAARRQTNF
jgi:hypothetical protein